MANIFKAQQQVNDHPNRNNFDLSKKSNVSLKFGTLYPVYCQPVVPGDSFSIDTAFNLKLMPVVFPVQTKMRAHMHYFYVRNKNLWSNWENWISNLVSQSEHSHPFISLPDSKFVNGSIHDFLGVPTSVALIDTVKVSSHAFTVPIPPHLGIVRYAPDLPNSADVKVSNCSTSTVTPGSTKFACFYIPLFSAVSTDNLDFILNDTSEYQVLSDFFNQCAGNISACLFDSPSDSVNDLLDSTLCFTPTSSPNVDYTDIFKVSGVNYLSSSYESTIGKQISKVVSNGHTPILAIYVNVDSSGLDFSDVPSWNANQFEIFYDASGSDVRDYSKLGLNLYRNNLHLNALPYRAYESIYYAYYNNNVLNPLTIGGQVQYNRYNTELGDGADTTDYHLFQRNYELDFLTSALPSPQQGVAPVVGMTALGDITIEDENGITTAHADVDNDGTITKVVLTSPAASNEHARTAMNIAACGMSINDFRSTNALQRVLETNIRKGYRYMDFIAGHFGKEPEYRELDMPEFIGGFSRDVSVSTVVSSADTLGDDSGKSLGSYGGFAQVVGGSNHSVRHYCDDYGYIIGILSVVPTPCYSQLLPKHMIAPDNFLDYYFPEMSQLGLQPITYKEVAPIQSYLDGLSDPSKSLEDTFGYQRPNYDMVSAVDEVHGEFRGSLRDYVINRIFDTRPELGQSFISINPSEINDIFVNTDSDDDSIIGEIGFSVHAKRPVPRVVIPNLGR